MTAPAAKLCPREPTQKILQALAEHSCYKLPADKVRLLLIWRAGIDAAPVAAAGVCCQKFDTCERACIPLVKHWKSAFVPPSAWPANALADCPKTQNGIHDMGGTICAYCGKTAPVAAAEPDPSLYLPPYARLAERDPSSDEIATIAKELCHDNDSTSSDRRQQGVRSESDGAGSQSRSDGSGAARTIRDALDSRRAEGRSAGSRRVPVTDQSASTPGTTRNAGPSQEGAAGSDADRKEVMPDGARTTDNRDRSDAVTGAAHPQNADDTDAKD